MIEMAVMWRKAGALPSFAAAPLTLVAATQTSIEVERWAAKFRKLRFHGIIVMVMKCDQWLEFYE